MYELSNQHVDITDRKVIQLGMQDQERGWARRLVAYWGYLHTDSLHSNKHVI